MSTRNSSRPLASVLTEVVSEVAYLIQTEIRLARAEVSEKIARAADGGKLIGAGAVLLLASLFLLLTAIVRFLVLAGIPDHWGFLIVGVIVAIAGVVLLMKGSNDLKGSALVPKRTIDQVRADISVVKEQVK